MKDSYLELNPNRIIQYLGKPSEEFTKADLIKFIEENHIEIVNFRHMAGDGRLKTLNFVINSKAQLDRLLSMGERVDGSSLFSHIDTASSDLYIIPRYKTAFVNPFSSVPTVDLLCSYYDKEGLPFSSAPEHVLRKAHSALEKSTGFNLKALGELEYYVIYENEHFYPATTQKGYHESSPFCRWERLRYEAMQIIAQTGGQIKYGHSEVGHILSDGPKMEQHEIEFMPVALEDAADQMAIAKWVLRMLGAKYGVVISFAPKVVVGHAGSGLHIHTKLVKDGKNVMIEEDRLSDTAKKVIAGYLNMASSLTAFGNTVPLSYLRLVPHQEAPTNICWGDRNRSVLVRVPLGWLNAKNMIGDANPNEEETSLTGADSQTVEVRSPDGSADIYLLLAGLAVAARHGLEMEKSLELAEKLYVDVNIFSPEHKKLQKSLPQLPRSCWDSAHELLKQREIYEQDGVFSSSLVDGLAKKLKSFNDKDLSERSYGKGDEIKRLVDKYFHCS